MWWGHRGWAWLTWKPPGISPTSSLNTTRDVPYLSASGAQDTGGHPVHRGGIATTVPGLGFVGIEFQRSFSSNSLRGVGRDAGYALARLSGGRG